MGHKFAYNSLGLTVLTAWKDLCCILSRLEREDLMGELTNVIFRR